MPRLQKLNTVSAFSPEMCSEGEQTQTCFSTFTERKVTRERESCRSQITWTSSRLIRYVPTATIGLVLLDQCLTSQSSGLYRDISMLSWDESMVAMDNPLIDQFWINATAGFSPDWNYKAGKLCHGGNVYSFAHVCSMYVCIYILISRASMRSTSGNIVI